MVNIKGNNVVKLINCITFARSAVFNETNCGAFRILRLIFQENLLETFQNFIKISKTTDFRL